MTQQFPNQEWNKLVANFMINVVARGGHKKSQLVPPDDVAYVLLKVLSKEISFSQAKDRYNELLKFYEFLESKKIST
jgi:hypothetical protein